jgi:hypothetical protein
MADDDGLLAWTFATFHTAALVVAGVTGLHLTGTLGGALAGLDTAVGLVAYGALWVTVWATNRRVLATATPGEDPRALLVAGAGWGAVTGVVFLLELVALLVGPRAVPATIPGLLDVAELLVVLGFVGAVAALLGSVVGAALALVDAGAARAARTLVDG